MVMDYRFGSNKPLRVNYKRQRCFLGSVLDLTGENAKEILCNAHSLDLKR
jgi:hypothetical protein